MRRSVPPEQSYMMESQSRVVPAVDGNSDGRRAFGLRQFTLNTGIFRGIVQLLYFSAAVSGSEDRTNRQSLPVLRFEQPLNILGQNIGFQIHLIAGLTASERGDRQGVRDQRHAKPIRFAVDNR